MNPDNIRALTLPALRGACINDDTALENGVRVAQENARGAANNDELIAGVRRAIVFAQEVSDRMDAEYGRQSFPRRTDVTA